MNHIQRQLNQQNKANRTKRPSLANRLSHLILPINHLALIPHPAVSTFFTFALVPFTFSLNEPNFCVYDLKIRIFAENKPNSGAIHLCNLVETVVSFSAKRSQFFKNVNNASKYRELSMFRYV
jgi:hypothetical protein